MSKLVTPEQVQPFYLEALHDPSCFHANEGDLVRAFIVLHQGGHVEERIPQHTVQDTLVREMAFRYGRADIVMFHTDGSATVVEAKDGSKGYNHVVGGIGQVGLYAAQLALNKGALTRVRRALMWSSTGDLFLDALIEKVCELASVIPLSYQSARELRAAEIATNRAVAAAMDARDMGPRR